MPTPRTSRFDQAQRAPHMPLRNNNLRDGAGRLIQRDVPTLPTGQTVADRLSSGPHLIADREFPLAALTQPARDALRDGLADVYLESSAGIRYQDTEMISVVHGGTAGWDVSGGGLIVGLVEDVDGNLTLGD